MIPFPAVGSCHRSSGGLIAPSRVIPLGEARFWSPPVALHPAGGDFSSIEAPRPVLFVFPSGTRHAKETLPFASGASWEVVSVWMWRWRLPLFQSEQRRVCSNGAPLRARTKGRALPMVETRAGSPLLDHARVHDLRPNTRV
jgi:hypothetical protein